MNASANERLTEAVAEHDNEISAIADSELKASRLVELRLRVQELVHQVDEWKQGLALRLAACIVWQLDGETAGEAAFRAAAAFDREHGYALGELETLISWQSFCGGLGFRDLLPQSNQEANRWAEEFGGASFPEEAYLRLGELAEDSGAQRVVWRHLLRSKTAGFAEENRSRVAAMEVQTSRMLRYAVDVGDVYGEAEASFLLGQIFEWQDRIAEAAEVFIRTLELGQLIELGELQFRSNAYLNTMNMIEFANNARPIIHRSIWKLPGPRESLTRVKALSSEENAPSAGITEVPQRKGRKIGPFRLPFG
jgi:hypothetical protein